MSIFFGNLFWGVLLILIGASIILRGFNINFPLVKIFIAIIIIMFGIKLLIGGWGIKTHHSNGIKSVRDSGFRKEYSTVFASSQIDLRNVKQDSKDIEISAVFGSAEVILPADVAFDIETTAVFGASILPDNSSVAFGTENRILNQNASGRKVKIEGNAIFGRLEFRIDPNATSSDPVIDPTGEGDF